MNRSSLLGGLFSRPLRGPPSLRPPGAVPEAEFVRRCLKCNKCAQVCPYGAIHMAHLDAGTRYGTPFIHARDVPCYLCMKCPPVCPTGALDVHLARKEDVRMGVAVIDTATCLAYNGVICRACFEQCPLFREAITLRDEHFPEVHPDRCVGCGICESVCLAEPAAITIRSFHDPQGPALQGRPVAGPAGSGGA